MAFTRPGAVERRQNSHAPLPPAPPLGELWEDFIDASASVIGAKTEGIYRYNWMQFRAWMADRGVPPTLESITKQLLVDYIAHLEQRPKGKGRGTLSRHSIQAYIRPIRTFLRWCVAEDLYPADPFAGPRGIMPHLGPRILKTAVTSDVEMLLDGCDDRGSGLHLRYRLRDRVIVLLGADAGLRTGEVCRLDIGDVNLDGGYVVVRESKWDNQRIVPISPEVRAAVRRYLRRARPVLTARPAEAAQDSEPLLVGRSGDRLTENALYQATCRAYRRAGGKKRFGLHRLRHHFGTETQRRGMPIGVTKELMGHEDIKTTNAYQHVTVEEAKAAHAKASPLNALGASRRRRLG